MSGKRCTHGAQTSRARRLNPSNTKPGWLGRRGIANALGYIHARHQRQTLNQNVYLLFSLSPSLAFGLRTIVSIAHDGGMRVQVRSGWSEKSCENGNYVVLLLRPTHTMKSRHSRTHSGAQTRQPQLIAHLFRGAEALSHACS